MNRECANLNLDFQYTVSCNDFVAMCDVQFARPGVSPFDGGVVAAGTLSSDKTYVENYRHYFPRSVTGGGGGRLKFYCRKFPSGIAGKRHLHSNAACKSDAKGENLRMGIVNELQASAESEDVLTALRKAKRVASKLNRQDISEWLDHEQNGYPNGSQVPEYRMIPVTFAYNTNGYIPAGYGLLKSGIENIGGLGLGLRIPLGESIGRVLTYIEREGRSIYQRLDGDVAHQIRSLFRASDPAIVSQLTFLAELNPTFIHDIPNQIKNKILDWALSLEKAGITGDDQSFTDPEKRLAQLTNFFFSDHSTNKTQAETMQGAFQIGSSHATQNATVTIDSKVADAIDRIAEAVASSPELDDVDKQEVKASLGFIQDLAVREQTTKSKMKLSEKLSAIAATISIATSLAPVVEPLLQLIKNKLGR
jgi:hypothetical protein